VITLGWACVLGQLVEALRQKPEGRGFDSMEIFIDLILPAALLLMGGLNLQQN
jgi:hypothetical protein